MYGIATAAPIALLEKRCGIIRRQAYFLAEYVDAPDAAEFFADTKVSAAQKDEAITLEQFRDAIEEVKVGSRFLGWLAEDGSKGLQSLLASQDKPSREIK